MFIIKELRRLLFRLLDFQLGTQPNSLKQKEKVSLIFSAVNLTCLTYDIMSAIILKLVSTKVYSTYTRPCEQGELLLV